MKEETQGYVISCLIAGGGVVCLATVFGFLGRFSWILDLFSHFRVQYFLGLIIIVAVLLAIRRRKTAAILLVFACLNLTVVLPLYFGGKETPPAGSFTMRAMLLNVCTRRGDAERVQRVIFDTDPDILVLEEISSQWMADLAWLTNTHPYSVVQPREDNFGIGLFSKTPLVESEIVYIGAAGVPSIIATVSIAETNLRVVATHPLPPGNLYCSRQRNEQLDQLADYTQSSLPLILLGDLNVTPWNYNFRRLLKRAKLSDSAKGRGVQPTWPNFNPLLLIPIDHCLHSSEIVIVDRKIGADVASDHYPVIVDFAIDRVKK